MSEVFLDKSVILNLFLGRAGKRGELTRLPHTIALFTKVFEGQVRAVITTDSVLVAYGRLRLWLTQIAGLTEKDAEERSRNEVIATLLRHYKEKHLAMTTIEPKDFKTAMEDSDVPLEDAVIISASKRNKIDTILTWDTTHFSRTRQKIVIKTPEDFLSPR